MDKGFFEFLFGQALQEGEAASAEGAQGAVIVREASLTDLDFALLGRAMSYRRTAAEYRGQARLLLECAAGVEAEVTAILRELHDGLAARGLGK